MRKSQPQTQTKKKKQLVNISKINNSPSPIKNSQHRHSTQTYEQPEQDKSIVIKHSELVLFTKKFASEKADYEDKISQLQSQNVDLRDKNIQLEKELQRTMANFEQLGSINRKFTSSNRQIKKYDQTRQYEQLLQEIAYLKNELNQAYSRIDVQRRHTTSEIQDLRQRQRQSLSILNIKTKQCQQKQYQIQNLKSQISQAEQIYLKIKTQFSQLRVTELEKARQSFSEKSMIDSEERIKVLECDISRLRNLNELFRTQLKNEDIELKNKNQEIQQLHRQIQVLQAQLQDQYYEQTARKKIDSLQNQKSHLQNQIFLQKANSKKLIEMQGKYIQLKGEIMIKNQRILELSAQLENTQGSTTKILIAKCCQLESHIERLNKIIIEMRATENKNTERNKSGDLQQYKKKYSEMLESMKSLHNQSSEGRFPPLQDLITELQQNPSKLRLMQNIISGLRFQNNELKSIIETQSRTLGYDGQQELRELVYEMTRNKIQKEEENQMLRFKVDQLNHELDIYKSIQSLQPSKSMSVYCNMKTPNKNVSERKRRKLNLLLKKVAEYSKEIVLPGDDQSISGDVYELIISKLMQHIENIQLRGRDHRQQSESSFTDE